MFAPLDPINIVNGVVSAAERGARPKPRLLIVDDDFHYVVKTAPKYEALGFDVVTALVADELAVKDDATLSMQWAGASIGQRAIGNAAQLKIVLDTVKPDAVLTDGHLANDNFSAPGDSHTSGGRALITEAKKSLPTIPYVLNTTSRRKESGIVRETDLIQKADGSLAKANFDIVSKEVDAQIVANHITAQLAKSRSAAVGV